MRQIYYFKATMYSSWYTSAMAFTREGAKARLQRAIEGTHRRKCTLVACTKAEYSAGKNFDGMYIKGKDDNPIF